MISAVCTLFFSGRWNELMKSAFLTVKYYNPENLIFQHLPIKKRIINPIKNNRLEEIDGTRNGKILDILTGNHIVGLAICGSVILEVYEAFFCHNVEYNHYTEIVTEMFEKRDLFNSLKNIYFTN